MRMKSLTALAVCGLALAMGSVALAQQSMDQLKESFKARYPRLQEQRRIGKIGETFAGFVEAVTPESAKEEAVRALVEGENRDRKALYAALGKQEGISETKVAERNGRRNFDKAQPGEYLKDASGVWRRK